jgi:hypothetical protein
MTPTQRKILANLRLNGCERTADALEAYLCGNASPGELIPDQSPIAKREHLARAAWERLKIAESLRNGHCL